MQPVLVAKAQVDKVLPCRWGKCIGIDKQPASRCPVKEQCFSDPMWEELEEPLTDLYVAVKVVADHLSVVTKELRVRTEEAQRHAETVRAQSAAILELSTPVIQVVDGVIVVPLIGTVDTHRSNQLVEQLLPAESMDGCRVRQDISEFIYVHTPELAELPVPVSICRSRVGWFFFCRAGFRSTSMTSRRGRARPSCP